VRLFYGAPRMTSERLRAIGRFMRGHIPELIVVALGLGLRISLTWTFDVTLGYDYPAHLQFAKYIQEHWRIPPYNLNYSTYNPSLFYWIAALLMKLGCSVQAVGRVAIICACLQLVVMWVGLEMYLRESRLARVLALLMFATLPAALHVAGFFSNHTLHDLACTTGTVLLPQIFLRRGRAVVGYAVGAGFAMGVALLTKVSCVSVLEALALALVIAVVRARNRFETARALMPGAALVFGVVALVGGWHYARHKIMYGRFVLIAFDAFEDIEPGFKIPYLDRRTFGFVGYWDTDLYRTPFWPSAIRPRPRFWPQLMITTFSDYFNFAFVPRPKPREPTIMINGKPMRTAAIGPAQAAAVGGTILAALLAAGWLGAARTTRRRQDWARLFLVLTAMFPVVNQLHFAVKYPFDNHGVIKGTYLQMAGPVMCALAALAIAWLWNRRHPISRALAVAGMAGMALSASYSIFAKVVVPLWG
jgi:4-amino-4-deoxy-L-arabinose transferase-like glycosyltransferase